MSFVDFFISAAVGAMITYLITAFIGAFVKPYPMSTLDQFVRKHFKSRKIIGEDLKFYREISIDGINSVENLFETISNRHNEGVNFKNEIFKNISATITMTRIQGLVLESIVEFGNINGPFMVEGLPPFVSISNEIEEQKISVTLTLLVKKWKLSDVKDILYDCNIFLDKFVEGLRAIGHSVTNGENTVSFKLNKSPAAINYLSKMNISYLQSDIGGTKFSMTKNSCSFQGINSSKEFELVINAMVMYI